MGDILDSLDEINDDFDLTDEELEPLSEDDYEMSEDEAHNITDAIKSSATATYILLAQAHQHKAWKALGYSTWADYVKEEFDISASRSYQLLDLSKAVAMLESATPEGTAVKLTEAQARDIKRELPNITEQIKEETKDLSPEDASEEVDRIIDEIREQNKLEDKEAEKKQKESEEKEEEERMEELEAQADAILEADSPSELTDSADDGLVEPDVDGSDDISPEDSMNIYNFFNVLSTVNTLPEPDDFVNAIPSSRADEVNQMLLESVAWFNRFQTLWELKN